MSRRSMDMGAEQQLAKFLDDYLYSWMVKELNFKSINRHTDQKSQLQGIDVSIQTAEKIYYIDEKAQLYYINKGLPTFAFEVNFINQRKELSEGWLFNDELLTGYYLLIWPFATHNDLKSITADDFTKLDCVMIKKNKIQEFLLAKGWDRQRVYERAAEIRSGTQFNKIEIGNEPDFYFFFSEARNYSEQPINIVIRKQKLLQLADREYIVTKDKVTKLK